MHVCGQIIRLIFNVLSSRMYMRFHTDAQGSLTGGPLGRSYWKLRRVRNG